MGKGITWLKNASQMGVYALFVSFMKQNVTVNIQITIKNMVVDIV
jgi:hypothetical protein